MNVNVKKVLSTVLGLVVTTLLGIFINMLVQFWENTGFRNEHEETIKKYMIASTDLNVTLKDIGGLEKIKKNIKNTILLPLKYPKLFTENKLLKPSKGVLFYGPPGTGKTMLVKALAKEANVPLLSLSASSLESKWFGDSNKLIASTFDVARTLQPCIIFFDEIDGIGKTRSDFDQSCVSTFKTELLARLDGVSNKSTDCFIVIACTNSVESLDPALKRRLPNQYKVELPTVTERTQILSIITKDEQMSTNDICQISTWTNGYSGSDLEALYQKVSNIRLQNDFENEDLIDSLANNEDISNKITKLTLNLWQDELGIVDEDEAAPP